PLERREARVRCLFDLSRTISSPTSSTQSAQSGHPECVGATQGTSRTVSGSWCEHYGIELETHHRALCDARATGHLLNLMNFKREGCAPDRAEEAA
ncbi:hypothetical protein, partial [Bradyrhizobium sp. AUGA SZCCT0182]|uniref:hypothetical protein n=1 Tax=Bradyrhizobium sp. AUGA SZCCT0182 TaxID=2807667 RepID=UPI00201104A9